MDENKREAVYLVDLDFLLHVKEGQNDSFRYTVFDKRTIEKVDSGGIYRDEVMNWMDPIHDALAAARDAAVEDADMDGFDIAQVGLTSLKDFPGSDIRRRERLEPETLPKDDICFIDSQYNELFRIPNGGTIEVETPDRTFFARCCYLDDCHVEISGRPFHICEFAELLERSDSFCCPESVSYMEQAAWRIGQKNYLVVELGADHWDYCLLDSSLTELKSGELEVLGCSINDVRDMVLKDCCLDRCSMTRANSSKIMELAAKRKEESRGENRTSVVERLSSLKGSQKDSPSSEPSKNHREPAR